MDDVRLKTALSKGDLSRTDSVLLCLSRSAGQPCTVAQIRSHARTLGLRAAAKWNVSQLLGAAKGLAIRVPKGWELTPAGEAHVRSKVDPTPTAPAAPAASLRTEALRLKNVKIRAFVEEAVTCYEQRLFRAAVVLSWVGAVAVLYDLVLTQHLAAFNTEAARRNPKWKAARTSDDLALMKEGEFLDVLEALSLLGKSVKTELKQALALRNGCGHPNSLLVSEQRTAGHIEVLVLNVFAKI